MTKAPTGLEYIPVERKTGQERLRLPDGVPGSQLIDFWAWSRSDLVSNTSRAVLAEFIIGTALGVTGGVREEWAPWDLTWEPDWELKPNEIKIEVKSAAYLQAWDQPSLSKITFGVAKTLTRVETRDAKNSVRARHADVYVLALLTEKDSSKIDPLDTGQWTFWVIPTYVLDQRTRSQSSISLATLERQFQERATDFSGLKAKVEQAAREQWRVRPPMDEETGQRHS